MWQYVWTIAGWVGPPLGAAIVAWIVGHFKGVKKGSRQEFERNERRRQYLAAQGGEQKGENA